MPKISAMVEGGKASAGAPLGPALGPLGVNIGKVVAEINEKTKAFAGVKVPVDVIVDSTKKTFEIKVGSPPTSALITQEAKIPKGAANPKADKVGELTLQQVRKIAEQKLPDLGSYTIKSAVNEVLGTCDSMGVHVNGKRAREVIREINKGEHAELLK